MGVFKELLVGLGAALATTGSLFALQVWYASYLDVAVIHGGVSSAPGEEKLRAALAEGQAQLRSGALPIEPAMAALAQRGRGAFPQLASKPSDDLSAMSGWVHRPNFKPYVPRPAAAPAADGTAVAQAAVSGAASAGPAPSGAGAR